jgi:predicted SnoaL-like aldol condensation-catalyzing enzyme
MRSFTMLELVDPNDSRAVRNKDTVLGFYDLVINKKQSEESVAKFISPGYIQHNPLIPDGPEALGKFFSQITKERANARVVVHRIIAVGDYVFAHVNFLNLFNDDPADGRRRKGGRALGHAAASRRPAELGPVARPEYPALQFQWDVLSGALGNSRGLNAERRPSRTEHQVRHPPAPRPTTPAPGTASQEPD